MKAYYNVHTHIFNEACVPSGFYGRKVTRVVDWITFFPQVRDAFVNALRVIRPFGKYDKGNALAEMVMQVTHDTQEGVLRELLEKYHEFPTMRFVVLSLDMDFMQAGESLINYPTQLYELINLKYKYREKILPFFCADPRRYQGKELRDIATEHIEKRGFAGIKIYPALGFYPFDPALYELYDYAESNRIPILTHCDTGGIYYRGQLTASQLNPQRLMNIDDAKGRMIPKWRSGDTTENMLKPLLEKKYEKTDLVTFKNNFTDPLCFREVLSVFKDLKICFAHFGGYEQIKASVDKKEKTWFDEIKLLMREFDNVYTDVSYTLHNKDLTDTLTGVIQDQQYASRILFGTDYFLVSRERDEIDIVNYFKKSLDDKDIKLFDTIASENPARFLELPKGLQYHYDKQNDKLPRKTNIS